jgi:hypothetical protein
VEPDDFTEWDLVVNALDVQLNEGLWTATIGFLKYPILGKIHRTLLLFLLFY